MSPKVSIITTTYKHEKFIAQTIESVLGQTFSDWELLIWDDSPDDAAWNIIQKYVARYPNKIKAWHHKPNKWIVDNMNFLLEQTSPQSEYISFLEWDDVYDLDNLMEKIKVFHDHWELALVHTDYTNIDWRNSIIQDNLSIMGSFFWRLKKLLVSEWKYVKSLYTMIKDGNCIKSFSAVMIRKNLFDHPYQLLNLDLKQKSFAPSDYFCRLRLLPGKYVYFLNKKLFFYRIHDSNLSRNSKTMIQQTIMIYEYFLLQNASDNRAYNMCKFKIYMSEVLLYLLEGDSSFKILKSLLLTYRFSLLSSFFKRFLVLCSLFLPRIIRNSLFQRYLL